MKLRSKIQHSMIMVITVTLLAAYALTTLVIYRQNVNLMERETRQEADYIVKAIDDEVLDYEKLTAKCRRINCNYIVLPDGASRVENMQAYHFEVIGQVGSYTVFKDMDWTE